MTLSSIHSTKTNRDSGDKAPFTLKLGTRWR